jgi:hypothetical protein
MWVLRAESPLALGSLYVRSPFQRKEKVEISSKVGGKLLSTVLGLSEGKLTTHKSLNRLETRLPIAKQIFRGDRNELEVHAPEIHRSVLELQPQLPARAVLVAPPNQHSFASALIDQIH